MKREVKVEEMLLSIIIPVYQVEKYIDECLKSVIKAIKEVDKVEVLLLDDGSKDGSALVCKQYEQEYSFIRYFHSENCGVSKTRNKGLLLAQGRYITFLDADDVLSIDFIDEVINAINKYDFDLCVFEYEDFCEDSNDPAVSIKRSKRYELFDKNSRPIEGGAFLERMFNSSTRVASVWGTVYRKDFLIHNSIRFEEEMISSEDFDFIIKCMVKAKNVENINSTAIFYRRERIGSATQKYNPYKLLCDLKMREKWYKYFVGESDRGSKFFANDFVFFLTKYCHIVLGNEHLLKYVKENIDVINGGSSRTSMLLKMFISILGVKPSLKLLCSIRKE